MLEDKFIASKYDRNLNNRLIRINQTPNKNKKEATIQTEYQSTDHFNSVTNKASPVQIDKKVELLKLLSRPRPEKALAPKSIVINLNKPPRSRFEMFCESSNG